MAARADGRCALIDIVDVARSARHARMETGQRELRRGIVVKLGAFPLRGGVAKRTIRWEACRNVVGIVSRLIEVGHVAARADGRCAFVDIVDVAAGALHRGVETGQRELRLGVVKNRTLPVCRRVADIAVLGEPGGHMVRVPGAVVVLEVAAVARRGRAFEHIVDVAGCASHARVETSQRELRRRVVVKLRALPLRGRMADRAFLGEPSRHVIGTVGRLVEVNHVAALASGGSALIDTVDMAGSASHARVETSQRELRCGIVVKLRALPLGGGVA